MGKIEIKTDPRVTKVFKGYPDTVRDKMYQLRNLVITSAEELEDVTFLEETLKWGEPSYIAKNGSTLRMDWKAKTPDQYAMYFKCTSRLVETFRNIYPTSFKYEGNRAMVFGLNEKIDEKRLIECIKAALVYHKVKQYPFLGISSTKKSATTKT